MDSSQQLMKSYIMKVGRGEKLAKPLTREEAREAMTLILEGRCSDFQAGAFLAAMRMKSETADEIAGFVWALREKAPEFPVKVRGLIDFGDPYDGKTKTANLSSLTALILAAASQPCVLHGERGIPAKYGVGSGEILEELGVKILSDAGGVARVLDEVGIGFIEPSRFLARLGALKPFRLQYGLRSSLNAVEKMWNPCAAETLVVGIYHAPYFPSTSEALLALQGARGIVVQGVEGFAELWLHRPTKYREVREGRVSEGTIVPRELGFLTGGQWDLGGENAARAHAEITRRVLEGGKGPAYEGALLNAGVKLFWAGKAGSPEEGIAMAREALDSGKALARLKELVRLTGEV